MIRAFLFGFSAVLVVGCGESAGSPADTRAPAPQTQTATVAPEVDALSAELKRGKRVFMRCRACHTLGEGERHGTGPNLHGMYGREAAALSDFNYSQALTESGLVWDTQTMDAWLERPSKLVPGRAWCSRACPRPRTGRRWTPICGR